MAGCARREVVLDTRFETMPYFRRTRPRPAGQPKFARRVPPPLVLRAKASTSSNSVWSAMKTLPFARRAAPPVPFRRLAVGIHVGLLGLGLSLLAQAQSDAPAAVPAPAADGSSTLPAVRVRATSEETAAGPVAGYVARRSATATKSDTPINEVPQSISVIGHEQLNDLGVTSLQDALGYSAGVTTGIYGARNTSEYFVIRGSKASTLLNGLRQGQVWFAEPGDEVYGFERIEVLRGPSAVIAGQTGPGGVVNLVSKRPQAEARREMSVQLGNRHRKQIAADFTGPLNQDGSVLYRVVGLGLDTGTQVDDADNQRTYFAPSLTWKPLAGTTFTAYGEYQRDANGNNDAFYPVVGTLQPAPNGQIPFERFVSEPGWDGNVGKRWRVGYEFEQVLGSGWTLRNHVRHDDSKRSLKSMYTAWWLGFLDATGAPDQNGRYLGRAWALNEGRTLTTAGDLLVEGKFATGAATHTLVTGVDVLRYRRTDSQFEDAATPLDVYTPTYGTFIPPTTIDESVAWHSQPKVQQLGFLVLDRIRWERWSFSAGLRHDDAKTTVSENSNRVDAWTKNLGALYLLDGGWSPYASYSESFEAQGASVTDYAYAPKRGKQYEAGVKWEPANGKTRATASIFRLEEENRLVRDPSNPLNQIEGAPVTIKGLELEAAANLGALDLLGQYTYLKAEDQQTGNEVAFTPKSSASAWAQYRFGVLGLEGFRVGLGVRYVGKTTDGTANVTVPAVTLGDAAVGWDGGDWRLSLNVTNLAGKEFVSSCDSSGYCWYGQKRRLVAQASYTF